MSHLELQQGHEDVCVETYFEIGCFDLSLTSFGRHSQDLVEVFLLSRPPAIFGLSAAPFTAKEAPFSRIPEQDRKHRRTIAEINRWENE